MAPKPCNIHVTGQGTISLPAEWAIVEIEINAEHRTKQKVAVDSVTAAANALQGLIYEYLQTDEQTGRALVDSPVADYSMKSVNTSQQNDVNWQAQKTDTVYKATVECTVKFRDFTALNVFAARASGMDRVTVHSVDWVLTEVTMDIKATETRKLAAKDAIEKARDFAQQFCSVAERDLADRVKPVQVNSKRPVNQRSLPKVHSMKIGTASGQSETTVLNFSPEDVTMTIDIEADFEVVDV